MGKILQNWKVTDRVLELESGHCHVWQINFSRTDVNYLTAYKPNLLSDQEQHRSKNFIFSNDKIRYQVIRSALRQLLSHYLQIAANEIKIEYNRFGKPILNRQRPLPPFYFNISHSNDLALLAFCSSSKIGVDVEYIKRHTKYRKIAQRFFSAQENSILQNVDEDKIAATFFRLWTRKEAFVKAVGTGLGFPLNKFTIAVDRENRPILVDVDHSKYNGPCSLYDVNCPRGYMSSIACLCADIEIDLFQWPMENP